MDFPCMTPCPPAPQCPPAFPISGTIAPLRFAIALLSFAPGTEAVWMVCIVCMTLVLLALIAATFFARRRHLLSPPPADAIAFIEMK